MAKRLKKDCGLKEDEKLWQIGRGFVVRDLPKTEEELRKLPEACVDLIYIDPPFNSNRNYEVFWGETKEKRSFEDRHESTKAYIEYMRPRCVELHRVLKKTGSFYYHCD